jgi:hypothetical protein
MHKWITTTAHFTASSLYFARALLKAVVIGGLVIATPILFVGIFFAVKYPAPPETPQQIEQQREFLEQQRELRAAQIRRFKDICSTKTLCSQFASTRQVCATAGNLDTCMSIKMEGFSKAQYECNTDGTLRFAPADLPNYFECRFYALQ